MPNPSIRHAMPTGSATKARAAAAKRLKNLFRHHPSLQIFHYSLPAPKISHWHNGKFIYPCHHYNKHNHSSNAKPHYSLLFSGLNNKNRPAIKNIKTIKNSIFYPFYEI
ncbi:hypothetical protein VB002_09450 [Campylobacter concisus]